MSPVNTDVPRWMDRSTPRAHTKQEFDARRTMHTPSLESLYVSIPLLCTVLTCFTDILENHDGNADDSDRPDTAESSERPVTSQLTGNAPEKAGEEGSSLGTALSECWTLCNTLANLSSTHRQRTFKFSGKQEVQEQAWRSCWRLCQQLYDSRDEDHASQVLPTLELCRDFCQWLFEARQKADDASDSVLRVSFELNNHLYNTHDRQLPEAFSERTLDFYITLCHRLMKQRTSLPQETDALLRACWNLAEMLFNLRQSNREGKRPDEELLGSAIQACWELCDLFREGWTQIRPDRGTPRPSQTKFPSQTSMTSSIGSHGRSKSSLSSRNLKASQSPRALPPETPSTIFDDASTATSSPDGGSVPHILILGPANSTNNTSTLMHPGTHHDRWSSNASALSDYSESDRSSQRSSSTATASSDEAQLIRLRCLLLKAGMNTGFSRISGQRLPDYVQSLPKAAFGGLPWQEKVFGYYKNLVLGDTSLVAVHSIPSRRLGANEVAKAVRWLGTEEKWAWVRDLYRIVFGFGIDEAERRGGSFQI